MYVTHSGLGGSLAKRVPSLRERPLFSSGSESVSESSNGSNILRSIGGGADKERIDV